MPDARIGIRVAEDRETVAIEITPLGQSGHPVSLTLDELDQLIGKLGTARSQMVQGQPIPPFEQDTPPISVVANTKWTIQASPPQGVLLGFYHPKFGRVGFTLSGEEIVRIVRFLTDRFTLQPTDSSGRH
jgi:hypothetical protein